jgi:hypothetical protein
MTYRLIRRVVLTAATALSAAGIAGLTLAGSPAASASNLGHRPAVQGPAVSTFPSWQNTFTKGTGNFCDNPLNTPCDGNAGAGDYGTIDQVKAGFSNGGFGNYAPGAPALPAGTGSLAHYAVLSGTTSANQGLGCQTAGTEGCTGPYAEKLPHSSVFPSSGFTATVYQYVDSSYAQTAGQGQPQFDTDMGLSDSSGNYLQDEVLTTCLDGSGNAAFSFGNGSPGTCGSSQAVSPGWYRYVFLTTNVGGKVFETARVLTGDGSTVVFDSGPQPVQVSGVTQTTSQVGADRYLWWPTLNVSGLPVGYVGVAAGQLQSGHAA